MVGPAISIRKAAQSDLDTIWLLWKSIMEQKIYFPYDDTYSRADISKVWINLSNPVYVAERAGEMVGAYILRPNQPGYGKHIVNAAYMVNGNHRGAGIGGYLCAHSVKTAKALGFRGMQFNLVVSTNQAAIRVWLANGFQIIGTVPGGFYHAELDRYVDAHIFFKDLIEN